MKLHETTILTNYVEEGKIHGHGFLQENIPYVYDTTIAAISDYLGIMKSKTTKQAVSITDDKGNFYLAAIVEYHKNESEEDMPGNWSYVFTTNKEDLKDCNVTEYTAPEFQRVWAKVGYNLYGMEIGNPLHITTIIMLTAKCLIDWMDVNAKEGQEVSVEREGYFVATVAVEDGEKVMSIVPDGAMKVMVKGDAGIEK